MQDHQIIAAVKVLISACAAALGVEDPEWHDPLMNRSSAMGEKRSVWRRSGKSASSTAQRQQRLLIICDREESGSHARMLQIALSNSEALECEVVIGLDNEDVWRAEADSASCGVLLLQRPKAC